MSNLIRQTTAGLARRMSVSTPIRRSIVSSTSTNKDFVQELYLRELKSYKPSPQSAQALQNQVRDFSMPPTPPAPSVPTAQDVAQELQSWDNVSLVNEAKPAAARDHPPRAHH
ncbi:ATP synthase complex subunit H-domain-containing protein [Phakopsora pachyrhizi]|nr:ATP synthase complex subunit H-domain-containing protein [Phakopsora pachyrhizi]